jgi:hypothetical protein
MKELIRHILREHTREIFETKWTDDKLRDEALKYLTTKDFREKSKSAYNLSYKKGKDFYDRITSHFDKSRYNFWDEDKVKDEALKYDLLRDFRTQSKSAYEWATSKGRDFFNNITSHMGRERKIQTPRYEYTDNELKQEALKFKTKKEFRNNNNVAYQQSMKRGKEFYDNITSHMEYLGNLTNRMIYAFLFQNKVIYVGLTYDIGVREKQHLQLDDKHKRSKSSVRDYIKLTGETPKMIKLTDYLPYKEAQKKEGEFIEQFKNDGYTILNVATAGNLGSSISVWTKDKLRDDALKYNKLSDWSKNNRSAVQTAKNFGKEFYDDITSHMFKRKTNKYTEEELENIVKKYSSLKDFVKNDYNAWQQVNNKGEEFYKKITSHLKRDRKERKKLSDDDLEILAKNFSYLVDFRKKEYGPYQQAIKRGKEFFNRITSHMVKKE